MDGLNNKDFQEVLSEVIGEDNSLIALDALSKESSVSIRLNDNKLHLLGVEGFYPFPEMLKVDWCPSGYYLKDRPKFTLDPYFHAGAYYVQDSSAMFVGNVFRQILHNYKNLGRPIRVLDLCAAPGGKTTDIATSLRQEFEDNFILIANEVIKQRATILAENIAKWGEPNICVTSCDPIEFSKLEGFFDIVVADVPCSGEGMFRKDKQAVEQWSKENINLCKLRQRRIIADIWGSMAAKSHLIYSTCTFNRLENDGNMEWIKENLRGEVLPIDYFNSNLIYTDNGISLVPGRVRGEGQYCGLILKDDNSVSDCRIANNKYHKISLPMISKYILGEYNIESKGDLFTCFPKIIFSEYEKIKSLRPIYSGVALGMIKGKDFIPHADLALSSMLNRKEFNITLVDKKQALDFFAKNTLFFPDSPKGINLLVYNNIPIGFIKNLGNRCNNLLPQCRRIRMNF